MIKKIAHHIKHTRPQWYTEYHEWQYHGVLHWATLIVSTLVIVMGFVSVLIELTSKEPIRLANAAQTHVRQDVTGGNLTISQTGDEYMATVSASVNHQDTAGDLGTVTVTDNRGSGAGWSATAQSTNFYKYNNPTTTSGSNTILLGSSTPYATSSGGIYTITIGDTGGTSGVATFDVSGLESANEVLTGSNVAIGTRGLYVNFNDTDYATGDQWTVRVDTIDVTRFSVTPGSVTTISGSSTNVTGGSLNFFDSTVENVALITAPANYGMGSYSVAPALGLGIPGNSYASEYVARITLTAS